MYTVKHTSFGLAAAMLSLLSLPTVTQAQIPDYQKDLAYAWISDGNAATVSAGYQLNPGGAPVTAVRTGVGTYTVTFTGSFIGTNWNVQTEAYGNTSNYCKTKGWGGAGFGVVDVVCFTAAGAPVNTPFTVQAVGGANIRNLAFALVDSPGTPNQAYVKNPGGTVVGTRVATGQYRITFNGLNGGGGTTQINAFGSSNARCISGGWQGSAASAIHTVYCTNPDGSPVDSSYLISVVPAGPTPAALGYAWADLPSSASYTPNSGWSYNSAGTMSITRSSPGVYAVTFAGLYPVSGGSVRATAYQQAQGGARCTVAGWVQASTDLRAQVVCFNAAGSSADSAFTILALPAIPNNCSYSFPFNTATAVISWPAAGGGTSILLQTQTGCPWNSSSNAAWLSVASGSSRGTGQSQVAFTAQPNNTGSTRSGTVSIAGVTIQVAQPSATTSFSMTCNPTTGPNTVGVSFTTTCTVAGGVAPYSFGLNPPNVLAAGLTAVQSGATTATVSGAPTTAGAYSFGIFGQDSSSPRQAVTVTFAGTIAEAAPAVSVTSLSPASATVGGPAFTLTVRGTGFLQSAQVLWNGSALSTSFVSTTQLAAAVPASLIAAAANATVAVSQSGTTFGSLPFSIVSAAAGTTSAMSHFAANDAWVTGLYVVNTSAAAAPFTIAFFDDAGQPVSIPVAGLGTVNQVSGSLPPNGSNYYEAGSPSLPVVTGSVRITAPASVSISGLFRLRLAGTQPGASDRFFEAAVNSSAGSKAFAMPFDATTFDVTGEQIYTGIGIASLDSSASATVTCIARDSAGNTIPNDVSIPVLQARGHWAGFDFPALLGKRGTLDCTATAPVSALAIRAFAANGAISTIPVILK